MNIIKANTQPSLNVTIGIDSMPAPIIVLMMVAVVIKKSDYLYLYLLFCYSMRLNIHLFLHFSHRLVHRAEYLHLHLLLRKKIAGVLMIRLA